MADLGVQHGFHQIRHGPHPLADLRAPLQPAGQTDTNVTILIGADPGGVFHLALGHHRPCLHGGVNFVARAVEETSIDKSNAGLGCADTLGKVDRCAALFIHDAQLDGIGRQPQRGLYPGKYLIRKGDFLGPVHLGFNHIDRARDRVAHTVSLLQIVHRDKRGHHRVHQPFADLQPVAVQNGGVRHQVTHVAYQHQRPPLKRQRTAVRGGVVAIAVHLARHLLATLFERLGQVAPHQAQPVAIGDNLVFGVHSGNAIFAIHDRRHRGFQQHISHARRIGFANVMRSVDLNFDVQAVVAQQDCVRRSRIPAVADKLRRIFQRRCQCPVSDGVSGHIRMAARGKRGCFIQKRLGLHHNPRASLCVIALALRQIP